MFRSQRIGDLTVQQVNGHAVLKLGTVTLEEFRGNRDGMDPYDRAVYFAKKLQQKGNQVWYAKD